MNFAHDLSSNPEASDSATRRTWLLLDADGNPYRSVSPGTFGGHRKTRPYGRLDCRAARNAIARGGYRKSRVFFADETTARAAGFRPCAVCLPRQYAEWKLSRGGEPPKIEEPKGPEGRM